MQKLDDSRYPATLRDKENQIRSSGEAMFYTEQGRGAFWPQEQVSEDLLTKNATTVQTSAGHTIQIRKVERFHAWGPVHYDFDFDAAKS